ncbi:phage tail protein [Cellulophaga sp. HaHaR_3_176]|uniref:type VI secretion system tube protein TssD n=1 Tax=Cellulophaga sp. HaHaR_3_176 TaxID=1942464 RepID=UPI001C1F4B8A|nr:type VI secretion system tube protein TssD [Cellulophaga sp. HaHaR_3_176]QWX84217.1 phage tail protein [Cellulophaga sp. HaHaR_3_176]
MSFKGKLELGGKEYNVLTSTYDLFQETDATGRPSSVTRGGRIKITVEATADTSLAEWMFNNFERRDGSIKFLKRDNEATAKELKFTEGYMVKYSESFDHTGENPMSESFMISARSITMGSGEHVNDWPE